MTKTLTAIALILAALPLSAQTQDAPRPALPTLDFATADANADGGITSDEWATYAASLMQGMMAQGIATRADGLITAGDADGDGLLSRDELVTAMTARAEERRAQRGEHGMGGQGRHGMMGRHGDEHGEGHGEGRHGWGRDHGDEGRGPGRLFARMDQDDNGIVSPEELAQAQEVMQRMAQRHGMN